VLRWDADEVPLDNITYREAKLILKPDHSRQGNFANDPKLVATYPTAAKALAPSSCQLQGQRIDVDADLWQTAPGLLRSRRRPRP